MSKKNANKEKGIVPATDKEKADLWCKVDWEGGFPSYLVDYGPDWELLERCGINIVELKAALAVIQKADTIVSGFEELVDEEETEVVEPGDDDYSEEEQ